MPGPPEFSRPQDCGRDSSVAVVSAAQELTVWFCDLPEVHTIFQAKKGLENFTFGIDHTLLHLHYAASPHFNVSIAEFSAMAVCDVEHGIFLAMPTLAIILHRHGLDGSKEQKLSMTPGFRETKKR